MRWLHIILEEVLEELFFHAPDSGDKIFTITADYVRKQFTEIHRDEDLSRFTL